MAVVSGSLSLAPDQRLFTETAPNGEADARPIIFTAGSAESAHPDRFEALSTVAEIRFAGEDSVSMPAVIESLGHDGAGVILAEGGPTLNGYLLAADLVDEMCMTLSPNLVGGASGRIVHSADEAARSMRLDRVGEGDGLLLLRYLRDR